MVDGRYLALAEEVVQRAVDLGLVQAQARDHVVVDHEARLQSLVLCVGVDVGELGEGAHHEPHPRLPGAQVGDGVRLQGVLVLGAGGAAPDADVLPGLQVQVCARLVPELAAQARDHRVRGHLALRTRLEGDEHVGAVALAAAGESDDGAHGRIVQHDVDEIAQLLAHRLEGDGLIGLDLAAHETGVLLREKTLRHADVEIDVQGHGHRQDQHHGGAVGEGPLEGPAVAVLQGVEGALAELVQAAALASCVVFLGHARTHHRRRGE